MDIDVSVIIVNYKTSNLIADCVKSIIDKTQEINYEVIIVDNNSESDFEKKIRDKQPISLSNNFHFLALPENIGFGRANNEGVKIAKGRNIFFLNPDTILLNNAIKILSDFLDTKKDVGACGGNLYDEKLNPTYSYKKILPGIFWEMNELLNDIPRKIIYHDNFYFNYNEKNTQVGYITGADLMIKKVVFDSVKGFRNEYFMYYEETDLCYRIKKDGWKIYNIPAAHIQHLESKSFQDNAPVQSDFKTKYLEESRNIYYRLNQGKISRGLANLIYYSFLYSRVMLIRNPQKKEYYKKRVRFATK